MVDMLTPEKPGFHVVFELRDIEDREETIKTGAPAWKDQEIAVVTYKGGNGNGVDKVVTPELLGLWENGTDRDPPYPNVIAKYHAWKNGLAAPVDGVDLANWPGVTPAQLKMCHQAVVFSVEDLASANADTIRKLGMGAVALKDKAISYLESADTNKNSEEISALKVEMDSLREAIAKKDEQIEKLMNGDDETEEDAPKRRGRPPKQKAA